MEFRGRLRGSAEDDISGWANFEWMPGGFFLEYRSEVNLRGISMFSFQMIGYDPATQKFTSSVYTSTDETPLPEEWDVQGREISIRSRGMVYAGEISVDGRSVAGGWTPMRRDGRGGAVVRRGMTRATPRIVRPEASGVRRDTRLPNSIESSCSSAFLGSGIDHHQPNVGGGRRCVGIARPDPRARRAVARLQNTSPDTGSLLPSALDPPR